MFIINRYDIIGGEKKGLSFNIANKVQELIGGIILAVVLVSVGVALGQI